MSGMCPVCGETNFEDQGWEYCPACDHPYPENESGSDGDDAEDFDDLDEDDEDDQDDEELADDEVGW